MVWIVLSPIAVYVAKNKVRSFVMLTMFAVVAIVASCFCGTRLNDIVFQTIGYNGPIYFLIGMMIRFGTFKIPDVKTIMLLIGIGVVLIVKIMASWIPSGSIVQSLVNRFMLFPFLLLLVWRIMPKSEWPVVVTSAAFPIYMVHMFANGISSLFIVSDTPFRWVLRCVVVVMLSFASVIVLKRFLPRTANLLFGGR